MNIHSLINYRDAISRVMLDDVIEITFAPGATLTVALEWDSPIATVVTKTPITWESVTTIPRSRVRGYLIKLAYDHAISSVSVRGTMIYPVLDVYRDAFCARREWNSSQEFHDAYFQNYPDHYFGFSENN